MAFRHCGKGADGWPAVAMAAEGAAGGFVVTSGRFTKEAEAFASGRNIQLVDGTVLKRWIAQHRNTTAQDESVVGEVQQGHEPSGPKCNAAISSTIQASIGAVP